MSTTGMESWAVDLKDVGAIYPFQGSEGLLVIIGLATWIAWHIWQMRSEKNIISHLELDIIVKWSLYKEK